MLRRVSRTFTSLINPRGFTTQLYTNSHHRLTLVRPYGISTSTFFQPEDKNSISDGAVEISKIDKIWLRENCQCDECYTHSTNQRHVLFHKLDRNVQPFEVRENEGKIKVTWSDGHKSEYDSRWLKDHVYPGNKSKYEKELWDGSKMQEKSLPIVPLDDFLHEDEALKTMLGSLQKYGIGLVTGVPTDVQGTQEACERVCFIQETFFGKMWAFSANMKHGDTAYTNIALGAHTDTTYLSCPAGVQVFHCVYHDGTGGETLLVDGFFCAEKLRNSDPEAFDLLSTIPIHHEYLEPGVNVRSLDTILKVHPGTKDLFNVRYNHYDRSPISTIPQYQVGSYYEALRKFSTLVEDKDNEYWIKLKPGTMIFVDNWRVMHGRASFTGNRNVVGSYLPYNDWVSKAKILGVM